ncbi:hypothetical protein FXB40_30950 [Bradyrhizobium rifense]|uniref:Uncharacterized protein n=1 Tax=Bradyrhizobium rifense TaxID=515499 RepID=A0A5D3K4Q8_9BRAD|nr:hypothetical protein FXB40_30950 [Bradyrhizobium rifense]
MDLSFETGESITRESPLVCGRRHTAQGAGQGLTRPPDWIPRGPEPSSFMRASVVFAGPESYACAPWTPKSSPPKSP